MKAWMGVAGCGQVWPGIRSQKMAINTVHRLSVFIMHVRSTGHLYRAGKRATVWPEWRHAGSQANFAVFPRSDSGAMQQFRSRICALVFAGWNGERAG
jgi:hypothetical protein